MSAGNALQAAVAGRLGALAGLAGVYDGPPARAGFPYVVLDGSLESDWGHKSGAGREVGLAVTLWDEDGERLQALGDAVEASVLATAAVEGWQLVSLRLIRRRTLRDVAGPWAVAIDFRARLLANLTGEA